MTGSRLTKTINKCVVMLAAALVALMCLPGLESFAAGGTITVNLGSLEGLDPAEFEGFTFDLYEVGGYDGPDFKLYPEYEDVNVRIPVKDVYEETMQEGDPTWEQAWLDSANTLANHILHPAEGEQPVSPVMTFSNIKPGDSFSYSNSEKNALYLLVGRTARIDNQNWTPLPMFVRTLDGSETYSISSGLDAAVKIRIEPVVFEHSLMKTWDDNNNSAGVRPETIEVGIYYGSQLIDTVTLGGEEGKWTYSWRSEEAGDTYYYITDNDGSEAKKAFEPGEDDNKWAVKEIVSEDEAKGEEAAAEVLKLRYYSPSYTTDSAEGSNSETFRIINTFSVKSIEIVKTIDGYVDTGDNAAFSFLIKGFITDREGTPQEIYTNHAGVSFSLTDGLTKSVRLDNIPGEVEYIEVTEEYSGNYKPDGDPKISYDEETRCWTVKMKNKHNDHQPGGGIVNRYEHDKSPEQH